MKNTTNKTALNKSEDYKDYGFSSKGGKPIPKAFPIARALTTTLVKPSNTMQTLFPEFDTEACSVVVSGDRKLTGYTFYSLCYALSQELYNQSYQRGYSDNEGIAKTTDSSLDAISNYVGKKLFYGNIRVTLSKLCRLAFGHKPDTKEREKVRAMLELLDSQKIILDFIWPTTEEDNDDKTQQIKKKLLVIWEEETLIKGETEYTIQLHPYFSYNIQNSYGLIPQDFVAKLSLIERRKDENYFKLVMFFSKNIRGKECIYTKRELLDLLGMLETYTKDKTRTEKTLHKYFENLVKVGYLEKWSVAETTIYKNKESITKYSFTICKNFGENVVPSAEKKAKM